MRGAFFFSLLLLLPSPVWGKQKTPPVRPPAATPGNSVAAGAKAPQHRPKIGVALEGGGAMGLAHIGVLKWFEEHHIPVEYVAGTRMGGLGGGFYATVRRRERVQSVIKGLD